jgi:FkbM family methyltransferase
MAQVIVTGLRRLIGRGPQAVFTRRGLRWKLDLNEGIDFSIYLLGAFEPSTVSAYQRLVKPGDTVLDIGANVGAHTLHLAEAVGATGTVIAFEPTAFAFAKLQANIALNPTLALRTAAGQIMLLDRADAPPTEIYSSWPLGNANGLHELHGGQLKSTQGARGVMLDQVVADMNLARVDFIKLDVDGFECQVLRGAAETLKRFHPVILMEIAPHVLKEQGESLESLVVLLTSHGYRFSHLSGAVLPTDVAALHRLVPDGVSLNVIARV